MLGLAVVAVAGACALANFGGAAAAPSAPTPVPAPTEPPLQLTLLIGPGGSLSLPSRTVAHCENLAPCPAGTNYTTIGLAALKVIVNDPSGTPAQLSMPSTRWGAKVGPHQKNTKKQMRMKPGANVLTVRSGANTLTFTFFAIANPYATITTTTSNPTTTTFPEGSHSVVTLNDTGLSADHTNLKAGVILFIDFRDLRIAPTGNPQLFIERPDGSNVQNLGGPHSGIANPLCAGDYQFHVRDGASDSGPSVAFRVDGFMPGCSSGPTTTLGL